MKAPTLLACAGALACAFALAPMAGCGSVPPPASAKSPVLGKKLPRIKRRAIDGSSVDTNEGQGRIVVVKFFAKYCEPCKKTLPAAEALHRERPDVMLIGVSEDEYRSEAQEMVSTYQLSFPVVHDPGNTVAGRFRVTDMPVTFVTDRSAIIRWVGGGKQKESDLEAAVESLSQ